jgi:hypothetical protein
MGDAAPPRSRAGFPEMDGRRGKVRKPLPRRPYFASYVFLPGPPTGSPWTADPPMSTDPLGRRLAQAAPARAKKTRACPARLTGVRAAPHACPAVPGRHRQYGGAPQFQPVRRFAAARASPRIIARLWPGRRDIGRKARFPDRPRRPGLSRPFSEFPPSPPPSPPRPGLGYSTNSTQPLLSGRVPNCTPTSSS